MSSRPVPSKSSSSAAPPPPCKIHPSAVVADKAQLTGTHAIEIGEGAVIHPHARLRSDYGRVTIGANSIVAEKAVVGVGELVPGEDHAVSISDNVAIESGAVVEAAHVGACTVIDIHAKVGRGARVGQWCRVAAAESVMDGEEVEDFTVIYAGGKRRADRTVQEHKEIRTAKLLVQEKTLEALRGVIVTSAGKWTGS